jgi:uncharacterized protein YjbJ (UPF0337 family)
MGHQEDLEIEAEIKEGEAKEAQGKAEGDKDLENEGIAQQKKAKLKQAGENVKDAFS